MARDVIVLSGEEGRHAATVRRLGPGEHVDITDGAGTMASCLVTAARPGTLELAVTGRSFEAAPIPRLTVIQAIPKGDRGEQAVETMTEVGADVIVPWAAERCVAQWRGDKADRGAARWRAIAAAAARQSRRRWFPEVTGLAGTDAVLARIAAVTAGGAGLAVLLDPGAGAPLTSVVGPGCAEIILVVGPEGGVSEAETARLTAAAAVGARLGPTVLRASSAGAVAAALVLTASGRWS